MPPTSSCPAPTSSSRSSAGSSEGEAGAERVARLEHELVEAREVRAARDLGDDGRKGFHLSIAGDPRLELRPDHARARTSRPAAGPLAVEQRQSCRCPAPARRAVDLAIGEDRDVAATLHEDDAV